MLLGKLRYLCYLIVGYIAPEIFGDFLDIEINWWIPIASAVVTVIIILAVEHIVLGIKAPFMAKNSSHEQ